MSPLPGMGARTVIVGAGPMGIYAAFLAARRGQDVLVLEADRIGASLSGWGSTRLFSPLDMNLPSGLREALPGLPAALSLLLALLLRLLLLRRHDQRQHQHRAQNETDSLHMMAPGSG